MRKRFSLVAVVAMVVAASSSPGLVAAQQAGGVPEQEMRRTFNCGLGLVLIVEPHHVPDVLEGLARAEEDAFVVGELARA